LANITGGFIKIPESIITYFLDTCVWSELVQSEKARCGFQAYFETENLLAGLSIFTIFELSRAGKLKHDLDRLFYSMRTNVWIPLLYDELFRLELDNYPAKVSMLWMPLSLITDEDNPEVLTKLANDSRFTSKRDEYLEFGDTEFMTLEKFKNNFSPSENGTYTTEQAQFFAWCNTVDFLGRQFRDFLIPFKDNAPSLDTSKLASIHMRGLFLFYKYYIHGQSPTRSDFMDFAHISYAPYVNYYVTEKNVANVLKHIQTSGNMISDTKPILVSEFISNMKMYG
jgi:hypothetical protein